MRCAVLACFALAALAASSAESQAGQPPPARPRTPCVQRPPAPRPRRWIVFRPMFVTQARRRALTWMSRQQELRRQSRQRGQRRRRALHIPGGTTGSADESGLALRVAVNDLLFQSAPANDLPALTALASASSAHVGAAGLRPMLLARLRSASRERGSGPEEEAFLLMSTAGGRPAIVPAATSRPQTEPSAPPAPQRRKVHKQAHNKLSKQRNKGGKLRRATRDTSRLNAKLGAQLDAQLNAMEDRADRISERVKKYDAEGSYPAYTYTHGRYTRAVPPAAGAKDVKVMKVKVRGADDDDDDETMEAAESVVFRPLFVHRDMQAAKQEAKRRRLGLPKKSTKPFVKPLRRRQPQQVWPGLPARIPAASYLNRRAYVNRPPRYYYAPYRRIVYYH